MFAFLYRMAHNLHIYVKFAVFTGSSPVIDTLSSAADNAMLELAEWRSFSMWFTSLPVINLIKRIVEDWLIFYVFSMHAVYLLHQEVSPSNQKFARLRKWLWNHGRTLVLGY